MRESIFSSAIRAFFITLFGIIGIIVGFIPLIWLFSSGVDTSIISEPEQVYTQEIVANAEGVRKVLSKDVPVILKINLEGVIGMEELTTSSFNRLLVESREGKLKNDRVKALVLFIDSPGGTVADADGIYRAIKQYKEQYKVPVYAFVDGICASGGLYIACAADEIYATDVSIVGSVGVIAPGFFNVSELLKTLKVDALTVYAGKGKDELNPFRPWKPDEAKNIQEIVDYFYTRFIEIVTSNRPKLDAKKLVDDYGARVFNASKAAELGYISAGGASYRETLQNLLKKLDITDDKYQVVQMKKETWYSQLFRSESSLFDGKITHQIKLPSELDPKFQGQFLYLYRPEGKQL